MTQARLLLVVSEAGSITNEARTSRRALYQETADKIGAELLVTAEGCGAQLLEVPGEALIGCPPPRLSPLLLGAFFGACGAGLVGAVLQLTGLG
jgi:hypothetical protein